MDSTTFRTPDSADNREPFGAQACASGKVASYRQVRAVSVTAIPTHLVADIAFGEYGQNEMPYAKTLVGRIADQFPHRLRPGLSVCRNSELIRRYLDAVMMADGMVSPRTEGTPQGALSPLLSNIRLPDWIGAWSSEATPSAITPTTAASTFEANGPASGSWRAVLGSWWRRSSSRSMREKRRGRGSF